MYVFLENYLEIRDWNNDSSNTIYRWIAYAGTCSNLTRVDSSKKLDTGGPIIPLSKLSNYRNLLDLAKL